MYKYCIAKIDMQRHVNFGEPWFYAQLEDGSFGWVECLLCKGIIWYDTVEEARDNLLDDNECVISHRFVDMGRLAKLPESPSPVAAKKAPKKREKEIKPSVDRQASIPIPHTGKGSKYDRILRDFIESGKDSICVENYGDVCVSSAVRGLRRYAEMMNHPVEVVNRFDQVYLVRVKPGETKNSPKARAKRNQQPRAAFMVAMV